MKTPLLLRLLHLLAGFALLWAFFFAGQQLKQWLHLILPGNVLGLFLLLIAISLKLVKIRWIEPAARFLLFLMPLLFVPIFVGSAADKQPWIEWGWLLVPSLVLAVMAMWIAVGHLTQWLDRRVETRRVS